MLHKSLLQCMSLENKGEIAPLVVTRCLNGVYSLMKLTVTQLA